MLPRDITIAEKANKQKKMQRSVGLMRTDLSMMVRT